ncbi:MAG: transcriptional repressor [Ruminococcus sp.]
MSKRKNFSTKRMAILNTICSTDCHPSAKWVYNNLKEKYPDLSLGTVYRNISLFKEEGVVNAVANVNGEERIDGITEPHSHFICTKCGSIYDIFNQELTALDSVLTDEGFHIESKSITYYGKCNKCS